MDKEFVFEEFEVELDGLGVLEGRVCGMVGLSVGGLHVEIDL